MPSHQDVSPHEEPWRLPSEYDTLSPNEQKQVMQACILKYLEAKGRATASAVRVSLGAKPGQEATVRRHLQLLAATQHIYADNFGRDPIYAKNGKLAHHTLQAFIRAGPKEYIIRTYNDPYAGRAVTITEFTVNPIGRSRPVGGVRIDLADFDEIMTKLQQIRDQLKADPTLLDASIKR